MKTKSVKRSRTKQGLFLEGLFSEASLWLTSKLKATSRWRLKLDNKTKIKHNQKLHLSLYVKNLLLLFMFVFLVMGMPEKSTAAENLQSLIDSLEEGGSLALEAKTYEGNLTINKSIELKGSEGTIIKGDGTGNVISIHAPNVKISNLAVSNSGMDRNAPEEYAGIKIHSDANTIENVKISNVFHGIYLSKSHRNTIKNNKIHGSGNGEIAGQGNGINVYYSNQNNIAGNTVEGSRDGIYFDYSDGNKIAGNEISRTRYGLHYMYSHSNTFNDNIFTLNTGGAAVMNSNDIKLTNNQFIFNYGHRSFGIFLLQSNDVLIENNTFYLNQRGIYSDQSNRSMIRGNRIIQNQIGIELWASSSAHIFTKNTISDNTIPAVTLGGHGGSNSWSLNKKGNNWGDSFPLTDLNQDNVGDFPITYRSSLYKLIEDQELTYLFLKSPALKMYEKINGLLNGEEVMFKDPQPLVSENGGPSKEFILVVIGLSLACLFIIKKGRHRLCIIFGKNGRKR